MKKYDDIVVGSGISGLTLALLLGLNGHRVLLLEKNTHIGGALTRFYREGIPFDTGFHFTGGFYKNGIFRNGSPIIKWSGINMIDAWSKAGQYELSLLISSCPLISFSI